MKIGTDTPFRVNDYLNREYVHQANQNKHKLYLEKARIKYRKNHKATEPERDAAENEAAQRRGRDLLPELKEYQALEDSRRGLTGAGIVVTLITAAELLAFAYLTGNSQPAPTQKQVENVIAQQDLQQRVDNLPSIDILAE